jgi:hypothetical protein
MAGKMILDNKRNQRVSDNFECGLSYFKYCFMRLWLLLTQTQRCVHTVSTREQLWQSVLLISTQ